MVEEGCAEVRRWHMLRRTVLGLVALLALAAAACTAPSGDGATDVGGNQAVAAVSPPRSADTLAVDELVVSLGRLANDQVPGAQISIAVVPMRTGDISAVEPDRLYKSASAAKAYWAAAAVRTAGIGPVEPLAHDTFAYSSDVTAAEMIDLAGGPNAVNTFTRDVVKMHDTGLVKWVANGAVLPNDKSNTSGVQTASNVEGRLGESNYTTARDMVTFLTRLQRGELLDARSTATVIDWMRLAPDDSSQEPYSGRLPEDLPPAVRTKVAHKAGWLLPNDTDPLDLLDFGIVYPTHADPYAIAVMGVTATQFPELERFIAHASCLVYQKVGNDPTWKCDA